MINECACECDALRHAAGQVMRISAAERSQADQARELVHFVALLVENAARVLETPDAVNIVTGNHTASAINPAADTIAEGDTTIARGIHAVAGIGPTTLSSGIPQ